jgi:hypothetical protein
VATLADFVIRGRTDMSQVGPEIRKGVVGPAGEAGHQAGTAFGKRMSGAVAGIGAGLSGLLAAAGAAHFIKGMIEEAREAAKVGRDTQTVITSTGGAAKVTAEHVSELAGQLSSMAGIDDELIQSGQNVLLTFTRVRNEVGRGNNIFDRASVLAVDLSARLGTDLVGANKLLGKALNDPIAGLGALRKVGVSFTADQEKAIKTLVKSGDALGAQRIILDELKKKFAGAASAMADPADKAKVAWANFQEDLGTRFMPMLNTLIEKFTEFLPTLERWINNIIEWVKNNRELVVHVLAVVAALKVFAIVMGVVNAVMALNPFGLIVIAIIALVAAFVYGYRNSETFRKIVQAALKGIADVAMWLWKNVIKPVVDFIVFYFKNVLAPVATWLWKYIFEPAFTAIGAVISWLWKNVITPVCLAIDLIMRNVVGPVISWLWKTIIQPAFKGMGEIISFTWNNVIKPVFNFLMSVIKDKIVPAFVNGVAAIKSAWEKVKDVAKVPIRFVVETVINKGILGAFNWVAEKFGMKPLPMVPLPAGFATGGVIPGHDTGRDSVMIAARPGEGVAVPELVRQIGVGRFLRWNREARTGKTVQGFADGGIVGLFSNPLSWVTDRVSGGLADLKSRFGNNAMGQAAAAMANRAVTFLVTKVKSLVEGAFFGNTSSIGQRIGSGGYLWQMAVLRSVFPGLPLISGFRPGSRTLSGSLSYHAVGRAVDLPPREDVARWIAMTYGAHTKELITPWQQYNILNGRHHQYTGAVWNQHNFAGGNAHDHWAYRLGGIVGMRSMDGGGFLQPGFNAVWNGTGRPEAVGAGGLEQVVELLRQLIEAVQAVAPGVGAQMMGASRLALQAGRAR